MKHDHHPRQPALLQRPSQQDQKGPAGPSAAFQTRRRTSSNLSGGSGAYGRRMSSAGRNHELASHEMLGARRGSLVAVSDELIAPRNSSPYGSRSSQQQDASNAQQNSTPSVIGETVTPEVQPAIPAAPAEDPVALQKKIMAEKREAARERKREQERREEEEKKERIRIRLLAMGPAPESKKLEKEQAKVASTVPLHIQAREVIKATTALSEGDLVKVDELTKHDASSLFVAHDSQEDQSAKIELSTPTPTDVQLLAVNRSSNAPSVSLHKEGHHTARTPYQQPPQGGRQSWQNSHTGHTGHPGQERYSNWSSSGMPPNETSGRNVWGPPNTAALGNGTFSPSLGMPSDADAVQAPHVPASDPGPIGPPTNVQRANGAQYGRGREQSSGQRPAPIGRPSAIPINMSRQEQQAKIAAWNNLPEKLAQEDAAALEQQQREDAAHQTLVAAGVSIDKPQPIYRDVWRQVGLKEDGTRTGTLKNVVSASAGATNALDVSPQLQEPGLTRPGPSQLPNGESWKSPILENGIRNDLSNLSKNGPQQGLSMNVSPPVRGSRFFPVKDIRLEESILFVRPSSPSPPPPCMAGHPAHDGDSRRPRVHFPRPPAEIPVVKLPPIMAPIGPPPPVPKPASWAAALAAPVAVTPRTISPTAVRVGAQQGDSKRGQVQAGQGDWQSRINNLVGKRDSPPKTHALAVDSASKSALELPAPHSSATVSLPGNTFGKSDTDNSMVTKPLAEECFEEQEMGSLPIVRFPTRSQSSSWTPIAAPTARSKNNRKILQPATTTIEMYTFPHETSNGMTVCIRFPGMGDARFITVPHAAETRPKSSTRGNGGQRGGNSRRGNSSHAPRGNKSTAGFSASKSNNISGHSSSPAPAHGGGRSRGGFSGPAQWGPRQVSTAS